VASFLFFKKSSELPALSVSAGLVLSRVYLPISKVQAYCMVSGRIRYTITLNLYSRHVFFERVSWGYNTGFFMAS